MRNRTPLVMTGCLALLMSGLAGGCATTSSPPTTQDSTADNASNLFQPPEERLGDDSPQFDPDAFLQGFNGSPSR